MMPPAAPGPTAPRAATPPRRWLEAAAALAGLGAALLLAEPVLGAAGAVWHGYVLPAYDEVIKNGVFAWCM